MEVRIRDTEAAVGETAAGIVADLVRARPECVLGLATGSTPIPMYRALIRMHADDGLDFSAVTTFNLDEYVGLGPGDPQSYWTFMHDEFFSHVNVPEANIHIPDGLALNLDVAARLYDESIAAAGGIDVQVLGIGGDGHVGFNEPTSSFGSRTRLKTLVEETRIDNARFFDSLDDVPHHVLTMGIGTILDARKVLLLATGESKADAVAAAIEGPLTSMVPASALQLHPDAIFVVDEAAASKLTLADYFREVEANKPAG